MKTVVVTGGCGYIGSHTVVDLIQNGYHVISIDSNIRSHESILKGVEKITGVTVKNYKVDLCDWASTYQVFEENPGIVGVIHFAALKAVGESVNVPLWYHSNNLNGLINILKCIRDFNVPNFIFSSSCSVYGNAEDLPVTEQTPWKEAESPYARTKQVGELIINDTTNTYKSINAIRLRYFNPAGAHSSNEIGELPYGKAQNLVPIITEVAAGKRQKLTVFGDDYETRDGSCVRDYIHIEDLAAAHTKALQYLESGANESNNEVFNLGLGEGATVLEAINAFEQENNLKLNYEIGPRRPGDVIAVYANNNHASTKLNWKPTRNINDIMRTAWAWQQKIS